MRVCFVLPCSGRYPVGGFRIVYEYANRLAERGHGVHLLHVALPAPHEVSVQRRWKSRLQVVRDKATGLYRPNTWFALDARVTTSMHFTFRASLCEGYDCVVATAWQTAAFVAGLPRRCGRRYYFIQHFETWNSDQAALLATWTLPLSKIVVAGWLGDIAREMGESATLVPNAIDTAFFALERDPARRPPRSILLQCHRLDWKGTKDAIEALIVLARRGQPFDLTLFGLVTPDRLGIDLPHRFVHNPPQGLLRQLYNDHAIFVSASWTEGWGLTPHEAASCGAALAVTDVGGHREFLSPGETALMSPPRDPAALAANLERLLTDDGFRCDLARKGHHAVQAYTWARSTDAFEKALTA